MTVVLQLGRLVAQRGRLADDLRRSLAAQERLASTDPLTEVARLRAAVRAGDTLARLGGEEFAVVAPATGNGGLGDLAERCRHAIGAEPFTVGTTCCT